MTPLEKIENYLVSQILSPEGLSQYRAGKVSKSELNPFVVELEAISRCYVGHGVGEKLSSPIRSDRSAEAYALYYTILNAAKVLHVAPLLSDLPESISVLDFGCGPGTVGLALLSGLSKSFSLTCVEQSKPMQSVARRLLSGFAAEAHPLKLSIMDGLPQEVGERFDLVVAANALAELSDETAEDMVVRLVERVAENGYLLVIEPGQLPHTRRLMSLRDSVLLNHVEMVPQFPCTHRDLCPMLGSSVTDWCHGTLDWTQPRLHAQLDSLLSFNKHRIKYSAFLFRRGGVLKQGARLVTEPKKTRLGVETTLCAKGLYGLVRIRKGERSDGNRALEKASVYDRLLFSELKVGDLPKDVVISVPSE